MLTDAQCRIQREPAFLRRKQVETRTGLSRSAIYQYSKDGVFPKPVPLGPRAVGWIESADFSLRQRVDRRPGEDRPRRWPAVGVANRMNGCRRHCNAWVAAPGDGPRRGRAH